MAEEEGPEQSPGPGTQPGPGQEHYDKFTIGEEEARQFPQPEFRSDLPEGPGKKHFKKFTIGDSEKDIQGLQPEWNPNLVDLKGALVADQGGEDEEAYDRYRAYGRAVATTMSRFSDPLQNIEEAKTKLSEAEKDQKEAEDKGDQKGAEIAKGVVEKTKTEIDRNKEKLRKRYTALVSQVLGSISTSIFDRAVDQKKNALSNYEYRNPQITIDTIKDSLEGLGGGEVVRSPEGKAWLKRADRDLDWADAFLWISVGQSVSVPYYYDVVLQLQALKDSRFRVYITEETLERTFSATLPGMEITKEELKSVETDEIGLVVESRYREGENPLIGEKEVVGLRELATRMLDASFESRMKLAAVSQFDFSNKENPEANTFLDKNLSSGELRFYKELFWRTKTTKTGDEGFILSPYLESKAKDYRQATATLEAILVTNANQRLKDILAGSGDKNAEMDKLIKQVKSERDERVANWFGRDKNDIVSQMATLVTRQGYLQDFSFMHAYRYCWGYIFEADSDGNPTGIKKVDTGGVNTPSGDLPSLYWARRAHNYDLQSNSRTQFLPPTQTDMRLKLRKDPLGEMDKYKPEDHDDAFLRKQWDRMFDKKFRNHRKSRGYPEELPEELAKALKNSAWIWRLPYSSTHVGESNKYPLDIVMFFPHNFDTANFFENASIVEGDKRATLWKKSALEGVPLSKIPWQEIDMQQVDNHLVNLEMGSRYMRTLIENFDEERDPFYSLVMRAPSTMGPKEAAKRLRLALRHNPDESSSVAELQFIPWYITQGVASKHRIIHPDAWERSTVTSEETKKVGYNRIDLFLEEMAYWRRAFWWLPGERGIAGPDGGEDLWGGGEFSLPEEGGEYTHYGRTMAMLGEYYQNVFIRWARASAEEAYPLTPGFYNTTREEYMKDKDYKFLLGKAAVHPYEPSHRALRR